MDLDARPIEEPTVLFYEYIEQACFGWGFNDSLILFYRRLLLYMYTVVFTYGHGPTQHPGIRSD